MKHLWAGGIKVNINPGHMNKMAVTPMLSNPFHNCLCQNQKPDNLENNHKAWGTQSSQSFLYMCIVKQYQHILEESETM